MNKYNQDADLLVKTLAVTILLGEKFEWLTQKEFNFLHTIIWIIYFV